MQYLRKGSLTNQLIVRVLLAAVNVHAFPFKNLKKTKQRAREVIATLERKCRGA